jgi:DNA-binding MarR family transcriptional regulator
LKNKRHRADSKTATPQSATSGSPPFPEQEILQRNTYVPHFLMVVTNALVWHSSRLYVKYLGMGLNECRILTILADSGPLSAVQIAQILSINKGAVSRALQVLEERGCLIAADKAYRRRFELTAKARPIQRRIVEIARAREALLLKGFNAAEKAELLTYLRRMQENIPLTLAYKPVKE